MGKAAEEAKPRVRRATLSQAIAHYVASIGGAIGWRLVKRKGRMEVQVDMGQQVEKQLTPPQQKS